MSKDAYWFKHDSNARGDTKLMQIKAIYGLKGLGIFWSIIEVLRDQKNYSWDEKLIGILAKMIDCDEPTMNSFITDCKRIELLTFDCGFFYSQRLKNDMEVWETKKNNRLGKKKITDLERNNNGITTNQQHKRRVEESREEEIRAQKNGFRDIPSEAESEDYFKSKNRTDFPIFFAYYKKRGWRGIENWRAAADEWILRGVEKEPKPTW